MVNLIINNVPVEVPEGTTIIQASKKAGFKVPTLCWHTDLKPTAACGICVCEIEGYATPKRACVTPVNEGMKITTNSKELRSVRKTILELVLANHDVTCPTCVANGKCELQQLSYTMDIDMEKVPTLLEKKPIDYSSPSIIRDTNKCINCGRCITVCNEMQTVYALTMADRGFEAHVDTAMSWGIGNSACVNCGQCTVYCPTGALREKDDTDKVWDALLDPTKHVVVQEAPAIRASIGDEFGMDMGTVTPGKMYATLKAMGFDSVMDTNFTADLTIMEEGTECVANLVKGGGKPVITSCSPGWIKFIETYFPDLTPYLSTAKSPMAMFGTLSKTYYAETNNIDPKDIVSVAVMPCTAKKFEILRPELRSSGYQDTDYVITTREFIRMIHETGIDFPNMPEAKPDEGMSFYSGAGTIFGATGGVMEAALRSAYFLATGEELVDPNIVAVRGLQGIKEAIVPVPGVGDVKIAVAHGLGNARKLMEVIQKQLNETGKTEYHFVEVMACPGGCVGGGGQPFGNAIADRARRGEALYKEDAKCEFRCSHHNPEITKIYAEFLGKPGSEKAHKLLHTHYFERSKFKGNAEKQTTGLDTHH
ncbi:MAG: ferredoxin [Candidatus Cloacimonetes bacterium 4572_65]|nr:MAG: ferredoxin [Candidatus Cloacimonetes bacterium 4572_65]